MMGAARLRERARQRAHWSAEDGVSLIELMMAMTILMIVMVGFSASMMSGLELNRSNRNRIIAANVASEQISTIQSLNFGVIEQWLVDEGAEIQVVRGDLVFTVNRDAQMVYEDAAGNACEGPSEGSAQPKYLRVSVQVTWPAMGGVRPVESDTLITPPVASYDPYAGHLAVRLTNREANPSIGHIVHAQSVDGTVSRSQTVTLQGCAFFANLPPGEYDISVDTAHHVDRASGVQKAEMRAPVSSASTYAVEINYDRAATLRATLAGAQGGTVPAGVPLTLWNENFSVLGYGSFPDNRTADQPYHVATPLYPFSDGFGIWGGRCPDADPEYQLTDGSWAYPGSQRQSVASDPNETTEITVTVASALISVRDSFGVPAAAQTVFARPAYQSEPDPEEPDVTQPVCDEAASPLIVSLDAGAQWLVALPYGSWTFWVQGQDPGSAGVTVTLSPGAASAHEVVVVTDG